jgi:hypothetical protein
MGTLVRDSALPLLAALLVCAPLFIHEFFSSHELLAPVMRLHEFDHVLRNDHRLTAPWMPDCAFGHGYPFYIFYAPLSTYVSECFHLLGLDLLQSVRASFGASLVLSAISIVLLLRTLNRIVGIRNTFWPVVLPAAIYVLTPYRLVDVFLRGALAECWSFVFFPLALLGYHLAVEKRCFCSPGTILGAVALACITLSHNIMGMYFTGIFCLYVFFMSRDVAGWITGAVQVIFGILLSAFFWLPAMKNMPLVGTDAATLWATASDVASHAVYLPQFLSLKWGYGVSVPGPGDDMPFMLGIPVALSVLMLLPAILSKSPWRRTGEISFQERLALTLAFLFVLCIFGMSVYMPWNWVPSLLRYIQFPWRLLALTTFIGAMAAWLAVHWLFSFFKLQDGESTWMRNLTGITLLLLIAFRCAPYMGATSLRVGDTDRAYILERIAVEEGAGVIGTTARAEYIPKGAHPCTINPDWNAANCTPEMARFIDGNGKILSHGKAGTRNQYKVEVQGKATLQFQCYYFPGWQATIDGERIDRELRRDEVGFILLDVPAGTHEIRFRYGNPPWFVTGLVMSLAALVFMFGILVLPSRYLYLPKVND